MGHYQLDVQPELVRAVKRTYAGIAAALDTEATGVKKTPAEIGQAWTGRAASTIKGDMTRLGGLLTTFTGHFETAAGALQTLAEAYDRGLEDLRTLNTQWGTATTTYDGTIAALQRQEDQDEKDLTSNDRTPSRWEREELRQVYADKRSGAWSAREEEYDRLDGEYEALVTRMRTATATAGRALHEATHVKVPSGVAVNLHDPTASAAALIALMDAAEEKLGDDLDLVQDRDERDDAQKARDADRLTELLGRFQYGSREQRAELLTMLDRYEGDPEFAGLLARELDPQQLALCLARMAEDVGKPGRAHPDLSRQELETQYLQLLEGLGASYGLATQVQGDYAIPRERLDQFVAAITREIRPGYGHEEWFGQGVALASVLAEGSWDPVFLSTVTSRVVEYEKTELPDHRWDSRIRGQLPTSQGWSQDPVETLMAAMANNRGAMQRLLTSGGTRTVKVDGRDVPVNENLAYLLMDRHWNDGGTRIKAALTLALADVPGDEVPAKLRGEIQAIVSFAEQEMQRLEAEAKARDKPWYVDLGHFVLDLGGLVPVVGEVADLINAGWYTAEGDTLNAALSGAGAVPFLGWAATGGKGIKGVKALLSPADFAKLEQRLQAFADAGHTLETGMLNGVPKVQVTFTSADEMAAALKAPQPNMVYRHGDLVCYTDDLGQIIVHGEGGMRRFMQITRHVTPGTRLKFWGHSFEVLADGSLAISKVASYKPIWGHGEAFNAANWHRYTHNEIYLDNGKRLDSYTPGQWIVERKFRQYADLADPTQLRRDIDLVVSQYPPGMYVPKTPGNLEHFPQVAGKTLKGRMMLEIPPQPKGLEPGILRHAQASNVTIRDTAGKIYTPEFPYGKLP